VATGCGGGGGGCRCSHAASSAVEIMTANSAPLRHCLRLPIFLATSDIRILHSLGTQLRNNPKVTISNAEGIFGFPHGRAKFWVCRRNRPGRSPTTGKPEVEQEHLAFTAA
jgi:hypothetical protein